MREILFRAKHKECNQWVEGDLIHEPFGECIQFVKDGCRSKIKVNPETVCQYTGLTDKNGRKIFEGDILRFEDCSNYPVVWDSDYCAFGSCWYSDFDHLSKYRSIKIEVVGNIFDNPELIGGTERNEE